MSQTPTLSLRRWPRAALPFTIALLATVLFAAQLAGGQMYAGAEPTECVAAAPSLAQARANFATNCSTARVDCDKLDSTWYCSDRVIGSNAPSGTGDGPPSTIEPDTSPPPSDEPVTVEQPSDESPETPGETPTAPDSTPDGACTASAQKLNDARTMFSEQCPTPRVDCDKLNGLWVCSDQVIGVAAPAVAPTPTEPPTTEPPTTEPPTTEPPTTEPPTTEPPVTEPPLPDGIHPDIVKVIDVEGRNPGSGWADSYSVGDACYCITTFDHNIGGIVVDTPDGPKTVKEVCEAIGDGPGAEGQPRYNDVQCGNGPPNDAGDEDDCPGRVDIGREGCGHIGPRWDLSILTT